MKKIGVLLSGCGVYDGAEIHESVLTLLAIDQAGAQYLCMAPDDTQMHVIDHTKGEPTGETRNMLTEGARIARGEITALKEVNLAELDALVLPGGFGAAKNLCDYAVNGRDCVVRPDVERAIRFFRDEQKPIAALCIAPVIIAKLFGAEGVEVTIGSDENTARDIEHFGAKHVVCSAEQCHVDETHNIITTPAYMSAASIKEAAAGISQLVTALLKRLS